MLRGRLASKYRILRSFFMAIVCEVVLTLVECLDSSYGLFILVWRILESLIQRTFCHAIIRWRFCRRSLFPRYGVTVRRAVSLEYKHLPLGKDRNITLFQLCSWFPFHGVRGTLRDFSLDSILSYEAISYHWGTVSGKCKMYVDGILFAVSQATYDALHARSTLWRTILFWIDYICIDQSNLVEKAEQISIMKDIYHQASRVIVCLGRPSNPSDEIRVHFLLQHSEEFSNISATELCEKFKNSHFSHKLPALVTFLCNPLFPRAWVIQEVAVAAKLEVTYGGQYFGWAHVLSTKNAPFSPDVPR